MNRRTVMLAGAALAVAVVLVTIAMALRPEPTPAGLARPRAVVALGRLEPGNRVLDVATPAGRLARLEVEVGDEVRKGDVLALLDSVPQLTAARDARRAALAKARLQLDAVVRLGPLEIEAAEADLRRLEAAREVATDDHRRLGALRRDNLVAEQAYDHQEADSRRAADEAAAARTRLAHLRGSQGNQQQQAEAALAEAEAQLADAEAQLERAHVRAPVDGSVLEILTWPGEAVGSQPILRLGETGTMYATAEVYETDLVLLSTGLSATATSPALGESLHGRVERIGRIIRANERLSTNPAAETDRRVAEVRVRLDRSDLAARFVNLQVDVEIPLPEPGAAR